MSPHQSPTVPQWTLADHQWWSLQCIPEEKRQVFEDYRHRQAAEAAIVAEIDRRIAWSLEAPGVDTREIYGRAALSSLRDWIAETAVAGEPN